MRELLDNFPKQTERAAMPAAVSQPRTNPRSAPLAIVLLSGVFIYFQVFVFPCTPRLATGDQAIYLHHATRMLEGQIIYRDYDHFTFPGTDVLYVGLFRLFGVRGWIPQAMLVGLGTTLVWLIMVISQKILSGSLVYLPALLFVALPFSGYLDATHHWYSSLAVTAALAVLLEERSYGRLAAAGVLIGIATFFTQSIGLLAVGFALFLFWEYKTVHQPRTLLLKKEMWLLASFVFTIALGMAYFVSKVGLRQIFYYTVFFVTKYYPADWFNNWRVYLTGRPQLHVWKTWFDLPAFALIHLIVPFIYILFLLKYASRRQQYSAENFHRLVLINVTGIFWFLTVASAPAYSRLYVISPPALVLFAWIVDTLRTVRRSMFRIAWAIVCVMLIAHPLFTQIRWKRYLDLPTGHTAIFEPLLYDKCAWMAARTYPSDFFFGDHMIAFVLRLHNVGRVPFLRPTDYTRPEEVANVISGLEKYHVRFVSWYIGLDREKDAARYPEGNHLAPIRQYLREHYHVARTFSNGDQIWERDE